MARVIHFEIPADDPQRAITFYRAAFAWEIERWKGPTEYWMVRTGEGPGINGALLPRAQLAVTTNTIGVEDLDMAIARVERHGGTTLPAMTIAGVGRFCYAQDTEGNLFGMMQHDPDAV
jgi:uncharacterized protein